VTVFTYWIEKLFVLVLSHPSTERAGSFYNSSYMRRFIWLDWSVQHYFTTRQKDYGWHDYMLVCFWAFHRRIDLFSRDAGLLPEIKIRKGRNLHCPFCWGIQLYHFHSHAPDPEPLCLRFKIVEKLVDWWLVTFE